jgi:microcystin-dependent protein
MRSIYTLLLAAAILCCLFAPAQTQAQTSIGVGTTTPDAQSILDVSSTSKGLLLPRLTAAEQSTLAATLTSAQLGMLVTDASSGKPIFWTGSAWKDASGLTVTATTPLSISSVNTVSLNPGTKTGDLITWDGTNWINMQPATQHFNITVDNRQPFLALNYCIALEGVFPSRNGISPFISEIDLYAFNFAPKGYALCNGQLLPINQNTALFALIGTSYGGNGTTTFELPNLQSRAAIHNGQGATLSNYTIGQTGGTETNNITR